MHKTVQKRSSVPVVAQFHPVQFDGSLPVVPNPHEDSVQSGSRLHYHDVAEISLCLSGRGVFFIEKDVHSYGEGTLFYLPANTLHIAHSQVTERPRWLTLYLDLTRINATPVMLLRSASVLHEALHMETAGGNSVSEAFHGLNRECAENDQLSLPGIHGYLNVLLVQLARHADPVSDSRSHNRDHRVRLAPALNLIAEQMDHPLTIPELARQSGMSESQFRRTFTKCMGQSPHQYIVQARIQFAKSLLSGEELPIVEVASRCGFETLSTFNRAFLRLTGMSPRTWRKQTR